MTRRLLKGIGRFRRPFQIDDGSWHQSYSDGTHMSPINLKYQVDDLLWVRESLRRGENGEVVYVADQEVHPDAEWIWKNKALPSIHCPRGLSRITLRVTAVKVQRLQDISEHDAMAEGVTATYPFTGNDTARKEFADLWKSIHGEKSWDENPWVAATSFERVKS
jgi:hypothetical protein